MLERCGIAHAEWIVAVEHVESEWVVLELHAGRIEQADTRNKLRILRCRRGGDATPIECPNSTTGRSLTARMNAPTFTACAA